MRRDGVIYGWVYKRGADITRGWKKRWFALPKGKLTASSELKYFDTPQATTPKGNIRRQGAEKLQEQLLELATTNPPTPPVVWKSSVRKILYSNARFRHNLPAADKNIFTFSAYA